MHFQLSTRVAATLSLLGAWGAFGADAGLAAGIPTADAGATPLALDGRIPRLRALLEGTLEATVEPQSLFEVSLADAAALQVEAVRVRALLRAADELARPPPATKKGAAAVGADAGTLRAELGSLDPAHWNARLELDRARLAFYELPAKRRAELLALHASRQEAARPKETAEQRHAREAEAERKQALEAARAARTEAERLVSEELARLISLEATVLAFKDEHRAQREALLARRDTVLGWQRRARDARAASGHEADVTYDALRRALRTSRDELSVALDAAASKVTDVPALGQDPLADIPPDVPTEQVRERRATVEGAIVETRRDERAVREERAAALLDEITTLNRERLALLDRLSSNKQDDVTGFTSAGFDQARAEARHLSLILRYHQHVALVWFTGGPSRLSVWAFAGVLIPWLLLGVAFRWARRRTPRLLAVADRRLGELDRADGRTTPSPQRRALRFLAKVHRPLEWLLLYFVFIWLLPARVHNLLEVQLLSSVVGWVLGGALVVNVINALASGRTGLALLDEGVSEELRLRSLRLVGRTVVVFALILVLSDRLVGQGTIYGWVFSTCWFASVPVFLLLVRWWRGTVFTRMDRARKKTRLQAWVLSNREGWKSFLAAMVGAVQLFTVGIVKTLRGWVSGFDLVRRIHAYLFKRELERRNDEDESAKLKPLDEAAVQAFDPERVADRWLACPADEVLSQVAERAAHGQGGVVAVVGARGMGKSTLARALEARVTGSRVLECAAHTTLNDVRKATEAGAPLVVLDAATALLRPIIGGLATFDQVISFARTHSAQTTWVFNLDVTLWPFLRRARDARPLFDQTFELEPWTEEQLGALLAERCSQAKVSPTYEDLLDRLPPGADEQDRLDALKSRRLGYERMLWDHVRGNPGLALEVYRSSLGVDAKGAVHVRPLQTPDTATLERLPDSSLFILRAVLQMGPAAVDDVAQATRLSVEQVVNAVRFGQAHGFFVEQNGRIRVVWRWLRPVFRLLERRHLLVNP